jgi:hypothetical protein
VSWLTRFETFEPTEDAGYSGTRHVAGADVLFVPWARIAITAGWQGGRDVTREHWFSWWEQGPRLSFRYEAAPGTRLGVDGLLAWRRYDEVDPALAAIDPTLATRRSDTIFDVTAFLEVELSDLWTLRASILVRRELSNIPDYTFTKVVPMIGFGYTVGLF